MAHWSLWCLLLAIVGRAAGMCGPQGADSSQYGCAMGKACIDAPSTDQWWLGNCAICPKGHYCPGGYSKKNQGNLALAVPCPAGKANSQFSSKSSNFCVPCDAGTYAPTGGSISCTACPVGSIAVSTGSIQCTTCEAGKHSDEATTCALCSTGRYGATAGAGECTLCAKGNYQALTGQTQCELCAASKYSDAEGLSACFDCGKGKAHKIQGASSTSVCENCPTGTYNPSPGGSCKQCSAGTANPSTGSFDASDCVGCATGKHQDGVGQNHCNFCSPNTFAAHQGQALCTPCPAGMTSAGGSSVCSEASTCKAGSYYSSIDALCIPCAPGTYAGVGAVMCTTCQNTERGDNKTTSLAGATSQADCFMVCPKGFYGTNDECTPCPPGSSNGQVGQASCEPCDAGKFQTSRGQEACLECSRGSYSLTSGSPVCHHCSAGKYGILTGADDSSVCVSCPPGSYSYSGATACKFAPPGSYTNHSGSNEYIMCPAGRYQPESGATWCKLTGIGHYSPAFSAVQFACPAGTASALTGRVSEDACAQCETGTVSKTGSANCTTCDSSLVPNIEQTTCVFDTETLSKKSIIMQLVSRGIALMVAGSVAVLYTAVAATMQYRREKFIGKEGFQIGAVPRVMVLVKSFISGLTFGSEVFLVAAMISDAPRLGAIMITFRALHAVLCGLLATALFGGHGWMKTVEKFGIEDARNLHWSMDLNFVGEHVPLVGVLIMLSCADVDLVPLWPWKKSEFHTESQGYPNMNIMTRSLMTNAAQSIVSMICQIMYLSSNHDQTTSSQEAQALFAANIAFTSIGVAIGMLSLFLKKGLLVRMEKERAEAANNVVTNGANGNNSSNNSNNSSSQELGQRYVDNPMLGSHASGQFPAVGAGAGSGAIGLAEALQSVESDNPIVQEIVRVLSLDARINEEKIARNGKVEELLQQVNSLKRQLNSYAASTTPRHHNQAASRSSTLDTSLELGEEDLEEEMNMGRQRPSHVGDGPRELRESQLDFSNVYGGGDDYESRL